MRPRRIPMVGAWVLILAPAVFLSSGCSTVSRPTSESPSSVLEKAGDEAVPESLWRRYLDAVEAAKHPTPDKISRNLLPLLPETEGLDFKDGRIRMVTWTRVKHFPSPPYVRGYRFPLYGSTWFTAYPEVERFCSGLFGKSSISNGELVVRLQQKIGLPPDSIHDVFVEVWVRPQDLFRPCPDPEITDSQCQLRIPLLGHPAPELRKDQPPWHCPPAGISPFQQQGKFTVVHQSHLNWMCENWLGSYTQEDPRRNYPWTALGYTYDWGNPEDPRGLSEFVALAGTEVVFERKIATAKYCSH